MSAVVFGYCDINEINTYDLDLQDLIDILSLKNYEPIPYYTKKDIQEAYIRVFHKYCRQAFSHQLSCFGIKTIMVFHSWDVSLLIYKTFIPSIRKKHKLEVILQ